MIFAFTNFCSGDAPTARFSTIGVAIGYDAGARGLCHYARLMHWPVLKRFGNERYWAKSFITLSFDYSSARYHTEPAGRRFPD